MECGVLVHIEDGRVVGIEGDPANPVNRGIKFSCFSPPPYGIF
ncbi:hypothetical protein ACFLVB_00295 [Chloroflexota bacterium]